MTALIKDYYEMPVDDYLDVTVTINNVSLDCDIYRVETGTELTASLLTGCIAEDANTQIIVGCNLFVPNGATFTPPYRCKGVVIGDVGSFRNEGTISMTARGASGEGKNIKLTADYQISAVGGNANSSPASGVLSCGGGGNGGNISTASKASGGKGTSFSGGAGGGGTGASAAYIAQAGSSTGGAGGNGYCTADANAAGGGGAGNPGGTKATHGSGTATNGSDGTGGLCVIIATDIQNLGSITSNGSNGGNAYSPISTFGGSGGGSGGGCIVLISRSNTLTGTTSVVGGSAGTSSNADGSAGGNGVFASYIVDDLDIIQLDINFVVTDSEHIDNLVPSDKVRFTTLLDEDELIYDVLGARHRAMRTDAEFTEFPVPPTSQFEDAVITNPQDGDVLVYDGTAGKWKNGVGGHEYSTTEKVVGLDLDGKPIYEKTFEYNSNELSYGAENKKNHNISNVDKIYICNELSYLRVSNNDGTFYWGFGTFVPTSPSNIGFFGLWCTNTQIDFYIGANFGGNTNQKVVITVHYTKTTDTALS